MLGDDMLRQVAAGEAGGITQGIGAYSINVKVENEMQACVFLDTPGHEVRTGFIGLISSITFLCLTVRGSGSSLC